MIQSSAYEVFEEMGGIKYLKRAVLRQGQEKFGKPTDEQRRRLEAIEDLPRLERLSLRLLKVGDWDALLKGR
ncbi:MAG TPA: hypothetical protein VFG68_05915 [Fimbriiglobus sp.]|nr:hypothetical protein [Fimbriiglobus sp.]